MREYKLEAHLESLCREHKNYQNLYSTWTLNRLTCANMLKSTLTRYPYFSMHDASHAEAVLSKIEMLLGERIQNLSPTDTWLLLHAAYAHDLGMVIQWSEIEQIWEEPSFKTFLNSLSASEDKETREAVRFVQTIQGGNGDFLWPLKAHRYVDIINATYFRGRHASMSRKYIRDSSTDFNVDLGHQGLIQPRIIKLLSNICELHTAQLSDVMQLDYQTDGVNADYAHPRFIAMMLRLGDLLDIDNGRFNTASELSFGGLPESSVPHKEKHEATTHLLVTPEEIQFRSDCPSTSSYLETRNFVTWLEEEINFLTVQWPKIAPKELGGYAPRFDQKELSIQGVQDIQELAGSRFEISQAKAFQIIEGSNIYEDRFVFVREILQNAMDASKLQLWRDLKAGIYRAWLPELDLSQLQPYDLKEEIYSSYPIHVRLSTLPDGMTQIEVEDCGTGISIDGFKNMCHVGTSNSNSTQIQADLQEMPNWLRPTAGFGVGLQSIFLLTDQFEIDTSTGTEAFHATLQSNRTGGYLQLQRAKLRPRGTIIRASFQMPRSFSYSPNGDTRVYMACHMDPIESENHIGEAQVLETIRHNCEVSMFPIQVTCAEESLNQLEITGKLPICNSDVSNWPVLENRYRFHANGNCTEFELWDMQSAAYGTIQLDNFYSNEVCFKGIHVNEGTYRYIIEVPYSLDVYGLDTKECLALSRSSLTDAGSKKVRQILNDFSRVYKSYILEQLKALQSESARGSFLQNFPIYAFWRTCDCRERDAIPPEILEQMTDMAVVYSRKSADEPFTYRIKPVKDLIVSLNDKYFLDLHNFAVSFGSYEDQRDRILSVLNDAKELGNIEIIADYTLTDGVCCVYWNQLIPICPDETFMIYRGTQADEGEAVLLDSSNIKRDILLGLSADIPCIRNSSSNLKQKAKRYVIPATRDYPELAVDRLPRNSVYPYGRFRYYIIAPFIREEAEQCSELSKEQFVKLVMTSNTFPKVVEYVLNHSPYGSTVSQERVEASYKKLIEDYYDAIREQALEET